MESGLGCEAGLDTTRSAVMVLKTPSVAAAPDGCPPEPADAPAVLAAGAAACVTVWTRVCVAVTVWVWTTVEVMTLSLVTVTVTVTAPESAPPGACPPLEPGAAVVCDIAPVPVACCPPLAPVACCDIDVTVTVLTTVTVRTSSAEAVVPDPPLAFEGDDAPLPCVVATADGCDSGLEPELLEEGDGEPTATVAVTVTVLVATQETSR